MADMNEDRERHFFVSIVKQRLRGRISAKIKTLLLRGNKPKQLQRAQKHRNCTYLDNCICVLPTLSYIFGVGFVMLAKEICEKLKELRRESYLQILRKMQSYRANTGIGHNFDNDLIHKAAIWESLESYMTKCCNYW